MCGECTMILYTHTQSYVAAKAITHLIHQLVLENGHSLHKLWNYVLHLLKHIERTLYMCDVDAVYFFAQDFSKLQLLHLGLGLGCDWFSHPLTIGPKEPKDRRKLLGAYGEEVH